jgi:membrane protease YdiL (CAAX protease family)
MDNPQAQTVSFLPCPWTLKDVLIASVYAFLFFLIFLFWPTAIYFLIKFFFKSFTFGVESFKTIPPFWILPLFYVALFIALKEKIFKKYKISEFDFFVRQDRIKQDIAYGLWAYAKFLGVVLLLGLLVMLVSSMWDMVFQTEVMEKINMLFMKSQIEKKTFEMRIDEMGIVAIVLFLVVAPFFEELFFRGCFYTALRLKFSFVFSNVSSSFIFSLLHGYSWFFGYVFFVGLLLASIYEKRRSLVAPLTFHMLNNLTVIVLFFL